MIAFHGQQAIKDKYIARVRAHREADNLVRGQGWENGRGCAIGCTLEAYDHSLYPTELGIPEWLARLEDKLFENLPIEDSQAWPERFLEAIRPGADLEKVKAPFLIFVLKSALQKFDHSKFPDCKKAIDDVIAFWCLPEVQRTEAAAAAMVAAATTEARAARAVEARPAAQAAWVASQAAAVTWVAGAAEAAVSEYNTTEAAVSEFADKLIELMEGA